MAPVLYRRRGTSRLRLIGLFFWVCRSARWLRSPRGSGWTWMALVWRNQWTPTF